MTFQIHSATKEDAAVWLRMREALWPEHTPAWHAREADKYFAGLLSMPLEVLIAADDDGRAIGFAELSIRAYAEGCETDRVAFLDVDGVMLGWDEKPRKELFAEDGLHLSPQGYQLWTTLLRPFLNP